MTAAVVYPMVQEAMPDGSIRRDAEAISVPPVLRIQARMRAGIRRTSRRVNPDALKREPDNARIRGEIGAGIAVAEPN